MKLARYYFLLVFLIYLTKTNALLGRLNNRNVLLLFRKSNLSAAEENNDDNRVSNEEDLRDSEETRNDAYEDNDQRPARRNIFRDEVPDLRRQNNVIVANESEQRSSSLEMPNWKKEHRLEWLKLKLLALNSTKPPGDIVNMVAARPWGVFCGDPTKHDMPWGNCLLQRECEPEYRLYRADIYCGRTDFVCCAIELTTYDMYPGFDASLGDSALATETRERKAAPIKSGTGAKQRRNERAKRKKLIRKTLDNMIKEMKSIINKEAKKGESHKKERTKELKAFIEVLKRKYRKDRQTVKSIHELEMIRIDGDLLKKVDAMLHLNSMKTMEASGNQSKALRANDMRENDVSKLLEYLSVIDRRDSDLTTIFENIIRPNDNIVRPEVIKTMMTNGSLSAQDIKALLKKYPGTAKLLNNITNAGSNNPMVLRSGPKSEEEAQATGETSTNTNKTSDHVDDVEVADSAKATLKEIIKNGTLTKETLEIIYKINPELEVTLKKLQKDINEAPDEITTKAGKAKAAAVQLKSVVDSAEAATKEVTEASETHKTRARATKGSMTTKKVKKHRKLKKAKKPIASSTTKSTSRRNKKHKHSKKKSRRTIDYPESDDDHKERLEYDIEYGHLYY